jgi:hypothetical protein
MHESNVPMRARVVLTSTLLSKPRQDFLTNDTYSRCVRKAQCFCEHRESWLWLSEGPMGFGEERQKIGPI